MLAIDLQLQRKLNHDFKLPNSSLRPASYFVNRSKGNPILLWRIMATIRVTTQKLGSWNYKLWAGLWYLLTCSGLKKKWTAWWVIYQLLNINIVFRASDFGWGFFLPVPGLWVPYVQLRLLDEGHSHLTLSTGNWCWALPLFSQNIWGAAEGGWNCVLIFLKFTFGLRWAVVFFSKVWTFLFLEAPFHNVLIPPPDCI